jgi:formylglycine-generating enzyme required for sulfatase activity
MSKKLTKLLLVGLCFSSAWDVQALLLPAPTPSLLPIPQRPTTFPLQRPSLVSDVIAWGHSALLSNKTDTVAVVSSPGWHGALALNNMGKVSYFEEWERGPDPIPVDLGDVVQVAASEDRHFLALKADGTVIAWGNNSYGQTNIPAGLSNVIQVDAGRNYSIALKSDGTVVAWGDNSSGETSIPTGLSNVVQVAAGEYHFLALKADGTVVAWGNNSSGKTSIPAGLSNVVQVATGYAHSIALKSDGTVVAWGDDSYGQTNIPAGLYNVIQVVAGYDHSIALKNDGTVVAWGNNQGGQSSAPANLNDVVQVVAGDWLSLALIHKKESMVSVQGGTFPQDSLLAGTTVSSFEIGKYEVTWGQWQEVRNWAVAQGYTDLVSAGNGTSANHPVRDVNWYDAVKWCNAKSEKEGLTPVYSVNGSVYRSGEFGTNQSDLVQKNDSAAGYRLPSQAEWQWSARGGVQSSGFTYSGSNDLDAVGWYLNNSNGTTHVVGSKAPNELGIYDMSGNVAEWGEDLGNVQQFGREYRLVDGRIVEFGIAFNNFYRCLFGGSWNFTAEDSRVVSNNAFQGQGDILINPPTLFCTHRAAEIGFRLARGVGSITPTPTPTPEPSPTPVDFAGFAGTYIGNFVDVDAADSAEAFMRNGQLLITVKSNRKFTGALFLNGRKVGFRGRFDANGNWDGAVTVAGFPVEIEMLLERGEVGKRISSSLIWSGEDATEFAMLPVAYSGGGGDVFAWKGSRLNVIFQSAAASGYNFGYGYAGVTCAKDGVMRFAGKLADNTAWSGVARVVENEAGGMSLPLAVRLPNGLLHGELEIYVNPEEGEAEMESTSPWLWIRQANAKSKTFAAGFEEELDVEGRLWAWTKGTSALGGSSANFTLTLSAPSGASLPTGADSLTGNLSASHRIMWSQSPPKGFSMKIVPSTGQVSGKVPATQGGKTVILPYQGVLFSENLDLGSGESARGVGFVTGNVSSGAMQISVP